MKKASEMSHQELAAALVAMPKRGRGRPKKDTARQSVQVPAPDIPAGHLYTAAGVHEVSASAFEQVRAAQVLVDKVIFTESATAVLEKHGLVPPTADPSASACAAWANDVPGIELPMPGETQIEGIPEPYAYPSFQPVLDDLPAGVRWATVIREPNNRNMKLVKFADDGSEDIAWIRSRELDRAGGRMEGMRIKLVVNPDAFQGGWIQWRG